MKHAVFTLAAMLVFPGAIQADTALIAVATNFAPVAEALAPGFAVATGHQVTITAGSSGKLYAQITQAAPFDAFLSADRTTPERLEAEGAAGPGTRYTYATGALVLWSADPARIGPDEPGYSSPDAVRRSRPREQGP